jgi:hypothetical protein
MALKGEGKEVFVKTKKKRGQRSCLTLLGPEAGTGAHWQWGLGPPQQVWPYSNYKRALVLNHESPRLCDGLLRPGTKAKGPGPKARREGQDDGGTLGKRERPSVYYQEPPPFILVVGG